MPHFGWLKAFLKFWGGRFGPLCAGCMVNVWQEKVDQNAVRPLIVCFGCDSTRNVKPIAEATYGWGMTCSRAGRPVLPPADCFDLSGRIASFWWRRTSAIDGPVIKEKKSSKDVQ